MGNLLDNDIIMAAANTPLPDEEDTSALAPDVQLPAPLSTPASSPEAVVPQQEVQPAIVSAPTKTSQQTSGSYRGITKQGLAVTTSLNKKADAAARADVAQFEPELQEEADAYELNAYHRKRANDLELEAQKRHFDEQRDIFHATQHFQNEQAQLEQAAYAQSHVVMQQYLTNYEHELTNVKMLAAQTGDPYERMGAGEAFGLIAAHAVQGFLKIGGHNIDVSGQTDRWVNREIAKHAQKVQDARQGAQDQFHLYQVARQGAMDEYEARERYRGMVLEGMKTQVQTEAARFGSQLAGATAAQTAAEIDSQLLGVKSALGERRRKMFMDFEQMRINQASEQARNSVAWAAEKRQRDELDYKKKKDAEQKPKLAPARIADPGATVRDANGKVVKIKNAWEIDERAPDSHKTKFLDSQTRYSAINRATTLLRELRPPAMEGEHGLIKKYGPEGAKERLSEEVRNYKRQVKHTVQAARHAIAGANLTPEEKQEWDSLLESDSGWQSGSNAASVDQFEMRYRNEFLAAMDSPYIRPLAPEEQDERPVNDLPNDTVAGYNAGVRGQKAETTAVANAEGAVTAVGRNEVDKPGFSIMFGKYMEETRDMRGAKTDGGKTSQRKEIDHVDRLAAIIAKPETEAQDAKYQKQLQQDAFRALNDLAAGKPSAKGKAPDPEVSAYAGWLVTQIQVANDPGVFHYNVTARTQSKSGGTLEEQDRERAARPERQRLITEGLTGTSLENPFDYSGNFSVDELHPE